MSLIADIKKLRELEQKATPEKWNNVPRNEHGTITRDDAKFIFEVRNLAPSLLRSWPGGGPWALDTMPSAG